MNAKGRTGNPLGQWVLGWLSAAGYYTPHGDVRLTDAMAVAAWVIAARATIIKT
jgi:hypothetical protein